MQAALKIQKGGTSGEERRESAQAASTMEYTVSLSVSLVGEARSERTQVPHQEAEDIRARVRQKREAHRR